LFGGGTDYKEWYRNNGGSVLTTSINHYCNLTCRYLPRFFEYKYRVVWSKVETVNHHNDIQHPTVRAVLNYLNVKAGVEIHHQGDLPARSGLGSSSAFTVGLLNSLFGLHRTLTDKKELANLSIHIERDVMKEDVGIQDQIQTAYGGINKIKIHQNGQYEVSPICLSEEQTDNLNNHLLLFFTGISRTASEIAKKKIKSISESKVELGVLSEMVDEAIRILQNKNTITDIGSLLHESWLIKQSLSGDVCPEIVNDFYQKARKAGAIGGKLLGAGGGGFMLLFAKPEYHSQIKNALSDLLLVPFKFEFKGSHILFYENTKFSKTALHENQFISSVSEAQSKVTEIRQHDYAHN
jgi:D-glycero-alpha-D-manno-heptose-7-phosphate kinase